MAIGTDSTAMGSQAVAGKHASDKDQEDGANTATAFGRKATATWQNSLAVGGYAVATNNASVAIGQNSNSNGTFGVAIGSASKSTHDEAVAIGSTSEAIEERATAIGANAKATGKYSIALGGSNRVVGEMTQATGENAIAIGRKAQALAKNAISIGTENIVKGENSGAFGDPSYVTGSGTYTIGNDNGNTISVRKDKVRVNSDSNPFAANEAGAFGNRNMMTNKATGSRVVGNDNHVSSENTYVIGSSVGATIKKEKLTDGTEINVKTKTADNTINNSIYLGDNSTMVKGDDTTADTSVKNIIDIDVEGSIDGSTIGGAFGSVTKATVGNVVTYSGFKGAKSAGGVSVGSAGAERRIMNVAAGEISSTSTDAINGSQLYAVAKGILDQLPVVYTDASGNKVTKIGDNFYPAGSVPSTDGKVYPKGTELKPDGTPKDPSVKPVEYIDTNKTPVIASMQNSGGSTTTPTTLANVASNLPSTYNKIDIQNGTTLVSKEAENYFQNLIRLMQTVSQIRLTTTPLQ